MRRYHLFEFEDLSLCPAHLRRGITEFLALTSRVTRIYRPSASILNRILKLMKHKRIVVLGAGSGGGIVELIPRLLPQTHLLLTDLYPPLDWQSRHSRVDYWNKSLNALDANEQFSGLRVLYSFFHHLEPREAKALLSSIVESNEPVAIFEMTERSLLSVMKSFAIPFYVLKWMWRVKPFPGRLISTYVIPVLPLMIWWDGFVSHLRTYTEDELLQMVSEFDSYQWQFESVRVGSKTMISFVGLPCHLFKVDAPVFEFSNSVSQSLSSKNPSSVLLSTL